MRAQLSLAILAPRMAALCTSEELGRTLVNASRLDNPPVSLGIPTLKTPRIRLRQGLHTLLSARAAQGLHLHSLMGILRRLGFLHKGFIFIG